MTAPVADDVVRVVVRDAIRSVWKNCPDLIENGAHARTVVAHIATVLNLRLETWPGLWRADVDYSLFHERGLQVIRERYLRVPDARAEHVYPNLIVHDPRGGGPDHRLLVLEAEKSGGTTPHRASAYRNSRASSNNSTTTRPSTSNTTPPPAPASNGSSPSSPTPTPPSRPAKSSESIPPGRRAWGEMKGLRSPSGRTR
ncbi:hypothetical protein ACIBCD_43015 [Nocardia brasiliensis]|uniref:hypothetical protein n=1 Tax=Nocardia brasiliensis TaxID=37326 RepID=UPI0037A51ACD